MRSFRFAALFVLALAVSVASFAQPAAARGKPAPLQLTGDNVIPGPGEFGALVEGKIGFSRTELCFDFVVQTLSGQVTRIAIHRGGAGFEGEEVVTLNPMLPGVMGFNGCVPVSRELAREISRNKSQFYVVIKTNLYPGGAVRAQLAQ